MDFSLSEEQQLLKNSVERFLAERGQLQSDAGQTWRELAELGWLAMPFAESDGGFGGGIVESCLVMEGLGRFRVSSPYWSSILLAGRLLAAADISPRRNALLEGLIAGEQRLSCAVFERSYCDEPAQLQCRAEPIESGWCLDGRKVLVLSPDAETLLVVARTTAPSGDLNAFIVPVGSPGVGRQRMQLMDGSECANITFDNVLLDREACLFPCGGLTEMLGVILEESVVALAAEAQGAMDALLQTTLEYVRNRKQFGVAIGSFQALQHRLVNMYTDAELCRAMLLRAQCAVLDNSPERPMVIAALKSLVGRKGRRLAEEAVQLHGGMGVSEEMPVGHYLKRLMMIDACLGNADLQRRKFYQQRYKHLNPGKTA